ncbi:hypothetical protein SCMU_03500 [Sinomonas cyclohexanicum]|uniref:Uncharacterized protein n=1 Tax=Sinomonas cyclohexanicum TaxID=322009 RepID=A0ABN6FCS0_SINCY|nr:hypothetical protein SCMU_03500 [Corynebacterium cyclohexanicum]
MEIKPVGAAVECSDGLVVACFRRHERDLVGRDVRRIREDHIHASPDTGGERGEEVAGVHVPAQWGEPGEVPACVLGGSRVDVRRVQLEGPLGPSVGLEGRREGAPSAAEPQQRSMTTAGEPGGSSGSIPCTAPAGGDPQEVTPRRR